MWLPNRCTRGQLAYEALCFTAELAEHATSDGVPGMVLGSLLTVRRSEMPTIGWTGCSRIDLRVSLPASGKPDRKPATGKKPFQLARGIVIAAPPMRCSDSTAL
jgi:hypothetical protein